jgi:hypothetical protein
MPKHKTNPSKPLDDSPRGRLNEDQERDKAVYLYLIENLTDLGTAAENEIEKPNESSIAKQWGLEDNRIFIRRVLRSVFSDRYPGEEEPTVPGLTIGKLVKILSSLERYWSEKKAETPIDRVPRILTRSEKLRALREFSQLSVEEREELNLPIRREEVLLQQLWERITDPVAGLEHSEIVHLYKTCLSQPARAVARDSNLQESLEKQAARGSNPQNSLKTQRDKLIKETIKKLIKPHFQGLRNEQEQSKIHYFKNKVEREISRIEFQAGLNQVKSFLGKEAVIDSQVNYLTNDFIERLTNALVENEIITDEFPITIENYVVEKTEPLPLYVQQKDRVYRQKKQLLNPRLLENEEDEEDINGLEKQVAYKISVNFHVKLKNYRFQTINQTEIPYMEEEEDLEFCEEIRGIGSPISHITAAINRFLLLDIPSLKDKYLPTVCELIKKSELIGGDNHSLVWSHTLVELCRKEDVQKAILKNKPYYDVARYHEPAFGEYCGFDLLEIGAKSVLMARLKAIAQTGVNPKQYLRELCFRVQEKKALKEAKKRIKYYPFSLKAMEGELYGTVLKTYYSRDSNFNFVEINPERSWSLVAYEAHLAIAEAYLKEGLYRIAKKYLSLIESHFDKFSPTIFDEFLLAKYSICKSRYNYLTDLQDNECLLADRFVAVRTALAKLHESEIYLKQYLKICYTVDELTPSNFNPFFHILSRIHMHRAKIHIFHSTYTELFSDRWDALLKPVKLLEKARIYAARDGDAARYSYYQAWCYLMVAYLADREKSIRPGFSSQDCIDWAHKLVHHAMICYSTTGQQCSQEIKDRGGSTELYESYGEMKIQAIPLIQESHEPQKQFYDDKNHILHIDLSILKQDIDDVKVYLFGTHSCILLFAMGMLELCEERQNDVKLLERVKTAIRIFTYCWAIAEDGGSEAEGDSNAIDRNFTEDGDALVRGLYLHRLTQFADLGRIFQVTCQLILLLCDRAAPDWESILEFADKLANNPEPPSGNVLGQKRYNGHLAEHYKKFKLYVHQLHKEKWRYANLSLIEVRDRVVKEVFKIIRGET